MLTILKEFSPTAFQMLKDADGFTNHPEIAEDYFDMCSRFIKQCPDLLYANELLRSILQCALLGLGLHHKEACSAVMQFVAWLIGEGGAPARAQSCFVGTDHLAPPSLRSRR